jgi:hypothetical protein
MCSLAGSIFLAMLISGKLILLFSSYCKERIHESTLQNLHAVKFYTTIKYFT